MCWRALLQCNVVCSGMSQSYTKLVGAVAVCWRALLRCNAVRSGMLQSYMEVGSSIYRVVVVEW